MTSRQERVRGPETGILDMPNTIVDQSGSKLRPDSTDETEKDVPWAKQSSQRVLAHRTAILRPIWVKSSRISSTKERRIRRKTTGSVRS
jgi:hypothetical protein